MGALTYVSNFFAGAFLINCVPHLVCALQGMPFPTPFAKPPGKGDSPPWVNLLWGFFNLLVGAYLVWLHPIPFEMSASLCIALVGALAMGLQLSFHFGSVQAKKRAGLDYTK